MSMAKATFHNKVLLPSKLSDSMECAKAPRECPTGVSGALWAAGSGVAKRVPRVVPEVSTSRPGLSRDTLSWALQSPKTPHGTLPRTPLFSGTLSRTLPETLRPEWPETGRRDCNQSVPDISRTHPSRDVILFGQILAKKRQKLFLYMTPGSLENKHFWHHVM